MPLSAAAMICIGLTVVGAGSACGQDYPNKPIRIVTSSAGGNGDFNARLIALGLTRALDQPVIVENRGGSTVPGEIVSKATPDGYTLLAYGSTLWTQALLDKTPFDPIKDFSPITLTSMSPSVLVVHPSLGVKSVKELIALAKSKPGAFNYAMAQSGSPAHLGGELLKSMAGIDMVGIPYKGAGPALNELIGGQVQFMFASAASVAPHVKSGKLIALAVASAQPSALFPGLPTVATTVPGFESGSTQGIWAPAKTPAALIKRLNQEIVRYLNGADVKEKYMSIGAEAVGNSPEQFAAVIKSDMARLGKLIKDAGIKMGS